MRMEMTDKEKQPLLIEVVELSLKTLQGEKLGAEQKQRLSHLLKQLDMTFPDAILAAREILLRS